MTDLILIAVLALVVGGAAWYVRRSQKRGAKCVGCPGGCGGCSGEKH